MFECVCARVCVCVCVFVCVCVCVLNRGDEGDAHHTHNTHKHTQTHTLDQSLAAGTVPPQQQRTRMPRRTTWTSARRSCPCFPRATAMTSLRLNARILMRTLTAARWSRTSMAASLSPRCVCVCVCVCVYTQITYFLDRLPCIPSCYMLTCLYVHI